MTNFIKKPIGIISIIVVLGLAAGGYFYFGRGEKQEFDVAIAKRSNLIQEVSVTGRVKPARSVELAFEKGGKVSAVYADIGKQVLAGQTLIGLENSELAAQLLQAEANLELEQAKLSELEKGTREEEIQNYETKVANAERSLADAKNNLEVVKQKTAADLDDAYDDALNAAQEAVNVGKTALLTFTDIQYAHFGLNDQDGIRIADAKAVAVKYLLGADNAGRWVTDFISILEGGAFGTVKNAVNNPVYKNIEQALTETIDALQKVKQALDVAPVSSAFTTTEKTNLSTEKNNIDSKITTVSGKRAAIVVQKSTNANNIASAESSITTAQNTLVSAKSDLALKQAGVASDQIAAQKAKIKSAQANIQNYRAQITKTIIRAPISGTITKQDAKVGEIVSANTPLVSLISASQFEIEANIPEADIAKVKLGNAATVTFDAYGNDVSFKVKVVAIDPAETIVEGVATYKTTFQFTDKDERIKSGLTANIDISTEKRENAIVVPQRAVLTKNGDKIVRILGGETPEEVKVKTGLRGKDGNIEIIEGLSEGDKVIIFFE